MAIYTKTGDKGETSLANMERVSKASLRLETYGTADELNAWVGVLRASVAGQPAIDEMLLWVQNRLFNLGAALSQAPGEWMTDADAHRLEQWIDEMQAAVPPQHCFVLPAGSEGIARAHVCRTVTRRLERLMVRLQADERQDITGTGEQLRFVNRLSDFFFVLSRYIAHLSGIEDVPWSKE